MLRAKRKPRDKSRKRLSFGHCSLTGSFKLKTSGVVLELPHHRDRARDRQEQEDPSSSTENLLDEDGGKNKGGEGENQ